MFWKSDYDQGKEAGENHQERVESGEADCGDMLDDAAHQLLGIIPTPGGTDYNQGYEDGKSEVADKNK